ncbi:MAG: hypothetical protein JWQ90_1935 [Hydrocarboniphaga sp.]|uniref:DUF1289 domain-containing protein n=1 Tax=Hydrocarboniphaga sp. TaxID=2033016 RepID=UPI002602FB74|nr:DUF1289 domain-containing protein [Hydrocarboniphaga sp.]MDB5969485.1 hypothetical protein [Hydrocarboniphaga sp.]
MATDTKTAPARSQLQIADRSLPPASPCVSICELDAAAKVCIGCGRSLDEIAEWSAASAGRRWQIRDAALTRLSVIESSTSSEPQ